jgi:hypothetical protein
VFHLFHIFEVFYNMFLYQLLTDESLVLPNLNKVGKHDPPYDWNTEKIIDADIENDVLLYYNTTTVAEALSFGFGDFCYIPDQLIESINSVMTNRKPKLPETVEKLRNALPSDEFEILFPIFAKNTTNKLNYMLPDIGVSKTGSCKPMPLVQSFNDTANGLRQFERFKQIGVDARYSTILGEDHITFIINTLNKYKYCSPYL